MARDPRKVARAVDIAFGCLAVVAYFVSWGLMLAIWWGACHR